MEVSMLQIQIINFISRKQLTAEKVLSKLLYHPPGAYEIESLNKENAEGFFWWRSLYWSKLSINNPTKFFNLSPNPFDILSFDIFLECDIAQGMIFKVERSGIIHIFTPDVDPGYIYIEKFWGGVQWFMMESKDIFSSTCFKMKNKKNQIVSFNGQSITFRLSSKEI